MDHKIIFETSPWFVLLCLLAGLFYAILLYKRKNPWTLRESILLGLVRFITVSVLAFLLLGPLARQIQNTIVEPAIVFVMDNSESIPANYSETELENINSSVSQVIEEVRRENFNVEVENLKGDTIVNLINLSYDQPVTNLNETLSEIERKYEGKNLQSVVLISDGIYNQGISPAYSTYSFPVYTVGIGDTIEKKDIILKSLLYNKIVYQGNRFPMIAEVTNNGFRGNNVQIDVIKNNKVIASQSVTLTKDQGYQKVEFELDAENSGIQRYLTAIRPERDEFSEKNNVQEAYIEIIEGKEKILLLASAPHPDIKVLRNAIEKNENYQLKTVIPGIYDYEEEKYDLVILHQLPDREGNFNNLIENFNRENIPVWYIIGENTHIARFNNINRNLSLRPLRNQFDNIFPALNQNFTLFNISDETKEMIPELPPIMVPFGEYGTNSEIEVILYQQVGKIVTNKPLFLLNKNQNIKEAVLTGTGIWQWRLHEFMEKQVFDGFDDLVGKVVQYLSAKEDKRKFRVYPVKNEFWDNEPVIFETEVYNEIYEKIYGQKIDLSIKHENDSSQSYSYVISPANSRFRISGLEPGVYRYTAISRINGEDNSASGMFSVQKMQVETTTLTANHQLLKELSRRSGGQFYEFSELNQLKENIRQTEVKSMILSSENYLAIINMKWIFFILLALFTIEWGFRKYLGGY